MATVLITGSTGSIGTDLVAHLKPKHDLILVNRTFDDAPSSLTEGATIKELDLVKQENWEGLLDGVDYVIQLAGQSDADAGFYESLLDLNYKLPYNLFSAAAESKSLKRVIYASSIHASSGYPSDVQVDVSDRPIPGDLYGVSKVYLEGLASYFAYQKQVESIGIRIGNFIGKDEPFEADSSPSIHAMYLSSRDFCQLIDCCLTADLEEPSLVVNGLSANTFPRLNIDSARVKLGYAPQDDAFKKAGIFKE